MGTVEIIRGISVSNPDTHEVTICPTLDIKKNVAKCDCGIEILFDNDAVPGFYPKPWIRLGQDNYIAHKMRELHKPFGNYRRGKRKK